MTRPTAMAPDASTSPVGHTPGPWAVEYDERESGHVIRMGEAIETPWSFPSEQVIRYDHTISPDDDDEQEQFATAEANAHLIAAAPDLYEALAMIGSMNTPSAEPTAVAMRKMARAAIAKARGTTSTPEVSHVG